MTHGVFGFGERNSGEMAILDFVVSFNLTIVNSLFKKKENRLVTFRGSSSKTELTTFLLGGTIEGCIKIVK